MIKAALASLLLLLAVLAPDVYAEAAVDPSCAFAGEAAPLVPAPPGEAQPSVAVWSADADDPHAGCDGVSFQSTKLAVVMRGRFRFDGQLDDLIGRLGAISTLSHLRYWSVTDKRWLELISEAYALQGPRADKPRGDFSAAELRQVRPVYYLQRDNRSSRPVIYRLQLDVRDPSDAVAEIENVTAVRYLMVTLFPPGALQTHIHVRRVGVHTWETLIVDRVGATASFLATGHDESYVNRTAAIFRHIAGIPSDLEPPAAP